MSYIILLSNGNFETFSSLNGVKAFILADTDGLTIGVYKASKLSFNLIEDVEFEEEAA